MSATADEYGTGDEANVTQRNAKQHQPEHRWPALLQPSIEHHEMEGNHGICSHCGSRIWQESTESTPQQAELGQQQIDHVMPSVTGIPSSKETNVSAAFDDIRLDRDTTDTSDRDLSTGSPASGGRHSDGSLEPGSNSLADTKQSSRSSQSSYDKEFGWYEDRFMAEVHRAPLRRERRPANFYAEHVVVTRVTRVNTLSLGQ